jgi:LytR cell envelope-related transcriptional attenuator
MSRSLHERIRQLETEVQDLQVLPAAAVRARGRSRGRRQRAAAAVAVAVVATTGGVAATRTFDWPHQRTAAPGLAAAQPSSGRGVHCVLALPDSPAAVRVRVLDGGAPAGLAGATATQLRQRQVTVLPGTGATPDPNTTGPVTLRYGPMAIGAATVLRAMLIDDTTMQFDPERGDDTIDLTLGATFERLATPTEVNQALVALGEPTAPPQCSNR